MDKIITQAALQEAILLLEMRQAEEGILLKEEFHDTYERLKPANIVNNIFSRTVKSPGIRGFVIDRSLDVAVVLLTNFFMRKMTGSFVKRTVGTVAVWGIKKIVSQNPALVKKAGTGIMKIFNNIIAKRNRNRNRNQEYAYSSSS